MTPLKITDARARELALAEPTYAAVRTALPDLLADRAVLLDALRRAEEALAWCGGSADFAPGGQARVGWERLVRAGLADLRALLASAEGAKP